MRLRHLLLGTACALGSIGAANAAEGWYFGLAGGANWLVDADYVVTGSTSYAGRNEYDTGFAVVSAVGYDYGRWRAEFEIGYRQNALDCVTNATGTGPCLAGIDGDIWELSQMVNVIYDIPLGGRFSASIGVGVGGVLVVADPDAINFTTSVPDLDDYVVAGQAIAGFSYELTDRLQLFADYRYFVADDPEFAFVAPGAGPSIATFEKSDHTALLGLRFDLQREAAPPPPPPPPPAPPPPVKAPKQFIVFFGFNKSNLTPEAARVVADAAAAAKEFGSASISIVGHTDSSGSNSYNQALSMKRAQTVKDGLGAEGIPSSMVSTAGRGETELMVQTGDGVKEPQNRRATIDLN